MRAEHGIGEEIDSLVLVENGQGYIYADAALRIVHGLGLPWKLAYGLMILPRSIREMAYRAFAKYRYKLFGQRNACMMPTPEMRERFL
jgi:predicted DCC family thiol-disulfide oxidoreductase YuxK